MITWTSRKRLSRYGAAVLGALCGAVLADPAVAGNVPREWRVELSDEDVPNGLVADGTGHVYVAGETLSAHTIRADAVVEKYASTGQRLWRRRLGTDGFDPAYGVATDGTGNVYLAGATTGSLAKANRGGWDAWVAKYDPDGAQMWRRQFGTKKDDIARAIATDADGNVYLAGSIGSNAFTHKAWLAKYDASGHLLWQRPFGAESWNDARGIATDSSGNVYVGGITYGSLGGPNIGEWDAVLAKFDADGTVLWTRQFGSTTNEFGGEVTVDAFGDIYIAGGTYGSFAGPSIGASDAWVAKFDASGLMLWAQQFGSWKEETVAGLTTNPAGNVYLSGTTSGAFARLVQGVTDVWLIKLDAAGGTQWKSQFHTTRYDQGLGLASDEMGNLYIAQRSFPLSSGRLTRNWLTKFTAEP